MRQACLAGLSAPEGGDGTQDNRVKPGISIVAFRARRPGDAKVGAKVFPCAAKGPDGSLTVTLFLVGKDGLASPMQIRFLFYQPRSRRRRDTVSRCRS